MSKAAELRKKYPRFIYESYAWKIVKNDLKVVFLFKIEQISPKIESGIEFRPEITIKNIDKKRIAKIGDCVLNNLVFNIGLVEIPSYWKATCSPEIVVKAGHLDADQIEWWRDLIINGMGQYFYENKIGFTKPDFLRIVSSGENSGCLFEKNLQKRYLVPMGGGRDSIVTLEMLLSQKKKVVCFLVNPFASALKAVKISKTGKPIIIERKIDPILLKLNTAGFLNGHVPFTALLSFLSVLSAVLFDFKFIAFSNEKSSNEGNVEYLGRNINHQWSKSADFENKFKFYCEKYLARNIVYASFLRKYTELEISRMFAGLKKYFSAFSSCNVVKRMKNASAGSGDRGKWCGECPKCLFVYISLYPFLSQKELLKIFNKDLYEDKNLLQLLNDLAGKGTMKPFECVGTFLETRAALCLGLRKAKQSGHIPLLLQNIEKLLE